MSNAIITSKMKKMIIAIVGPTGVGKTKMSIELAKEYNAIIINYDAVQVYKKLDIGSAKITEEEKEGIKHYLIDFINPLDNYTVKDYQKDMRKVIEENKNKNIILVGGTGLYLNAGLFNYEFNIDLNNDNYENYSNEKLYQMALAKDKNMNIHQNNRIRLIRFLQKDNNISLNNKKLLYDNVYFIGLKTDRNILYNKINERVDKMVADGLLKEVKDLYQKYPNSLILKRAIGYKEIIAYLNNDISLEDAKDKIKQNSRHYAKRQFTWFNHQVNAKWFDIDYDNFDKTVKEVKDYLQTKVDGI